MWAAYLLEKHDLWIAVSSFSFLGAWAWADCFRSHIGNKTRLRHLYRVPVVRSEVGPVLDESSFAFKIAACAMCVLAPPTQAHQAVPRSRRLHFLNCQQQKRLIHAF